MPPRAKPSRQSARLKAKLPADSIRDSLIQPPSTSKREVDDIRSSDEHGVKRARLTRQNLALLEKMIKRMEESLGYSVSSGSVPGAPESTIVSSAAKTTSTAKSRFAIQAYDNEILNAVNSRPPANLDDIISRGLRARETASPTESMYEAYVDRVERAPNKTTIVVETSTMLLKSHPKGYTRVFDQPFSGLPKDAGFNKGLPAPQPDFVEGLVLREYAPVPIHRDITGSVLYKDDVNSIALPHLAGELKGRGQDMGVAQLQSAYDGAALVFSRNQALAHVDKPDPPGHAHVTTFTTDGTTLNIYAHYATPSASGTLEYHQHRIKSINLADSHQGLNDGCRWLRNVQDYAREQSYDLRDQLKEQWEQRRRLRGTDDGDAERAGCVVPEQSFQPTPAESSHVAPSPSKSRAPSESSVNVPRGSGQKRMASSSPKDSRELTNPKRRLKLDWYHRQLAGLS